MKSETKEKETETKPKKEKLFLQYRGKVTEDYVRKLRRIEAPVSIILTTRKLRSFLPSLKPQIPKMLRSGVVYKFTCPRCGACYVGYTRRRLIERYNEHKGRKFKAVRTHLDECEAEATEDCMEVLMSSNRAKWHIQALEALFIKQYNPAINTKDEWNRLELTIDVADVCA